MQDTFSGKNIIYCNNNLTSDNKAFRNYIKELQYEVDDSENLLEDAAINEYIDINQTLAKDVMNYDDKSSNIVEKTLKENTGEDSKTQTESKTDDDASNNISSFDSLSILSNAIDYSSDDFLDEVQEDLENDLEDNNHEKC